MGRFDGIFVARGRRGFERQAFEASRRADGAGRRARGLAGFIIDITLSRRSLVVVVSKPSDKRAHNKRVRRERTWLKNVDDPPNNVAR